MDRTGMDYEITEGTDVYGSDGDKVGSVVAVQPSYIVVEKGFFFPTDYYIPRSAVSSFDEGRIYLNVTKDAALSQGWDTEPTGVDDYVTTGYATDVETTTTTGVGYGSDVARSDAGYVETDTMATGMASSTAGATRVDADDNLRIQVHEEELTATTRSREIGQVQIEKDIVAEEQVLEVPVTEERVRVQRRVVDRAADASDTNVFEEGVIEVPIRGEEVDIQKQVRVSEEIEIGKETVQRTERVADTVRREEVRVSETVDEASGQVRSTGGGVRSAAENVVDEGKDLLDRATDAVRDTGRNR